MNLVTGRELRSLFETLSPFNGDLSLKPEGLRRSVLAVNANYPLGISLPAFFHAAALRGGSPLIVQASGAALETLGKGLTQESCAPVSDLRAGARLMAGACAAYAAIYRPMFVAMGLDHFAVPGVEEALSVEDPEIPLVPCPPAASVRDRLRDALEACRGCGIDPPGEDLAAYEDYLGSQSYRRSLAGFMAVVEEMRPAWAMIDTGEMPAALNFAITREVCDMVRERGSDAVVEAEYGATGLSGAGDSYMPLYGRRLDDFAREVACFVKYTGAGGISYPIGMEHASPAAVKHEPDIARLEVVQREIIRSAGRYAPFAQHGGTGAREVARGLVAKNNVNTRFLVAAAQSIAAHVAKHREDIAKGQKSACGTGMYLAASAAVLDAAVEKIKECGTFGVLPLL